MIRLVTIALVFIILTSLFSIQTQTPTQTLSQSGSGCASNFNNFCLTKKPRGFAHPLCSWWKNFNDSRLATGPPRRQSDPSFDKVFRDKFIKVDNHSLPMPTQLDGFPLDVHDPFKKNFPPQKAISEVVNPVIWNRVDVDQPLEDDPSRQVGGEPISEPLSAIIAKHNWPNLPFYTVPEFTSYHPDYFGDSSSFCMKNPKHRLCPNHWNTLS